MTHYFWIHLSSLSFLWCLLLAHGRKIFDFYIDQLQKFDKKEGGYNSHLKSLRHNKHILYG